MARACFKRSGYVFNQKTALGKDYSGTAMYAQAGIDKAFHGSGYQFDPTFSVENVESINGNISLPTD